MTEKGECHVCGEEVAVDGEQAVERFGNILCRECVDKPVVFRATCQRDGCDWSHEANHNEFNRGHVKTRAQQEANWHENSKDVLENETHKTEVTEVEP